MANYIGGKFGQADHAKLVTPVNFPDQALDPCICRFRCRLNYAVHSVAVMTVVLVLQADYQERVDPNDKQAQTLLEEMRAHIKKAHTHLLVLTAVDGLLLLCSNTLQPGVCS